MQQEQNAIIYRADYTPPAYWIDSVDLSFDLDPAKTRVLNKMQVRRNSDLPAQALRLDGEDLNLARVLVNGQGVAFKIEGLQLVLDNLPDTFELEILTTCAPIKNTQLMGLYVSGDSFFTQCEAQGFRRITYFSDRPDVMSHYSVTLRADKTKYPVLLSNGNLAEHGDLPEGKHFARWVDPHKKPCYLFALVAGQLACREQNITSRAGTWHLLQIYVRPGDLDKTEHAMRSLMAAIAWDESRFGLHLDLERFMIVAVSDFNMGAMENKGLNIFNTQYVLANESTATDTDYDNIEAVIGHEYFHNWSGNRVTCRDWFQLSLKEGLTVFRDQEFSQDLTTSASARAVKRIEDVRTLRNVQFSEDAGPMAHPVRPDHYMEISNFYTSTVYEKGSEVVRMMQTLVGRGGFQKGMSLYFERHDGQAVTCDDFAQAIADANPNSALTALLVPFKRWYSQAGTPRVKVQTAYDAEQQTYTVTLTQSCPATPDNTQAKEPFVIPIALGLVDTQTGANLPLQLANEPAPTTQPRTFVMAQASEVLRFVGVPHEPVPSLLRGFSAPVILEIEYTTSQLLTLLAHDIDPFNRWEAGQRLALRTTIELIQSGIPTSEIRLDAAYIEALGSLLRDPALDPAFKDIVLTQPTESYIAEQLDSIDPQRIHAVSQAIHNQLATALYDDWAAAYAASAKTTAAGRALRNKALTYLCRASQFNGNTVWPGKAYQQVKDGGNFTLCFGALTALAHSHQPLAKEALAHFYARFRNEPLVIDKWFSLQASTPERQGEVLGLVRQLMTHPDFQLRNPNRARSLISTYCHANPAGFHRADAAGYVFWSERVLELDAINPQIAARFARAMDRWKRLSEPYQSAAHEAMKRVAAKPDLSKDVREVLTRALAH